MASSRGALVTVGQVGVLAKWGLWTNVYDLYPQGLQYSSEHWEPWGDGCCPGTGWAQVARGTLRLTSR